MASEQLSHKARIDVDPCGLLSEGCRASTAAATRATTGYVTSRVVTERVETSSYIAQSEFESVLIGVLFNVNI